MTTLRETYKGRKLIVKRGREYGHLTTVVNGVVLGNTITRDAEREMTSLRAWVDAADERRLTEPDAYSAHWYVGAPAA